VEVGDLLLEMTSGDIALVLKKLKHRGHWLVLWSDSQSPTPLDDILITSGYIKVLGKHEPR